MLPALSQRQAQAPTQFSGVLITPGTYEIYPGDATYGEDRFIGKGELKIHDGATGKEVTVSGAEAEVAALEAFAGNLAENYERRLQQHLSDPETKDTELITGYIPDSPAYQKARNLLNAVITAALGKEQRYILPEESSRLLLLAAPNLPGKSPDFQVIASAYRLNSRYDHVDGVYKSPDFALPTP
jgi:hypothetical protein